jgi:hypothetical protein
VLLALPIWTLLVWATRIRIILTQDAELTDLVVPVVLSVLAIGALIERRRWLASLAAATVAVWLVRLPLVMLHDHAAAFKVVHAALAVVSIWLALAAWRALRPRRLPRPRPGSRTGRSSAPS